MACIIITFEKWGLPVVDCFRNAYVAEQLTQGKLLYQQIFYQYGPLIPYLNSLLFKIFGINLKVLYISGICVSYSIVILVYILSRLFVSAYRSLLVTLLILSNCIFACEIYQFVYPYCYEAIYGSLLSLIFIIYCIIIMNNKQYHKASLIIPAIIASIFTLIKHDFTIAAYLTLYLYYIICFIENKSNKKYILYSFMLSVILPVLYYGIISLYIDPDLLISNLFPRLDFYSSIPRLPFASLELFFDTLSKALIFSVLAFFFGFTVFFLAMVYYTIESGVKYIVLFILISLLTLLFIVNPASIPANLISNLANQNFFQGLGIFLLCYFVYTLICSFKKSQSGLNSNISILFLTFASLILLFRGFLTISSLSASNYNILPGLIVLNYFIMSIVDNLKTTKIKKSCITISVFIVIILIIGANFTNNFREYTLLTTPIKTSRGVIYSYPEYSIPLNQAIKYVMDNTTKSDTVLAIPDEVIINFMSGRNSPSSYYQFLPCYNDAYYEPKIISELKKNKPDLILVSNNTVSLLYNGKIWGLNYNKKLFSWIQSNYALSKIFGTTDYSKDFNYVIYLFKKK